MVKNKHLQKKAWSVHGEILSAMRRSANKYTVLEMYDINEQGELNDMRNRELVDDFISQKRDPTDAEMLKWNIDMVAYYKQRKEELVNKGKASSVQSKQIIEEDDVFQDDSGMAQCMEGDEIRGMDEGFCDKWCIIMLGWNTDVVNLYVIPYAKQSLSCRVDTIKWNTKLFCTFVYAANGGNERRELWKDLKDMNEFRDCINNIEIEDVDSSGLFYTWTKNLFKAKKRAFKFSNFVADKEEFLPLVKLLCEENVDGCQMFKTVKKLKGLKKDMKKLSWKNGDVFENVKLREKQKEYVAAMKDEKKILYQKAKVKWLSVGDRNNA
ncbi:hypothetical protein Tco_1388265 [Tanacetum coccineum]